MSLTARLYFAGVDLTAFRLVDSLGLEAATTFVVGSYVDLSYGLAYVPVAASAGALVGGVLLAVAGLRQRHAGRRARRVVDRLGVDLSRRAEG